MILYFIKLCPLILLFFAYTGVAFGDEPVYFNKKVALGEFKNPTNWSGELNPARILVKLLKSRLENYPGIYWVSMPEATTKTSNLISDKALANAQFVLTGTIHSIRTALPINPGTSRLESRLSKSAEAEVELQVWHGFTGRLLARKNLIARTEPDTSTSEMKPSDNFMDSRVYDFLEKSMRMILGRIVDQAAFFLLEWSNRLPLEAIIVEERSDADEVVLNVGLGDGVEVRDEFLVYRLVSGYRDPLSQTDLGDRYEHQGVVRIRQTGAHFSVGVVLAGENFKPGFLARSRHLKPVPKSILDSLRKKTEPANFTSPAVVAGTRPMSRQIPRKTFHSFDFFSLFGWDIRY